MTDLLRRLEQHPQVLGLLAFGSNDPRQQRTTGDYDLFVVLADHASEISSLHFFAGGTPVDLNLIALKALATLSPVDSFRFQALRQARLLYDRTGAVAQALAAVQQPRLAGQLSEHASARMRHWHRHVLDKLQGRRESMPLLCQLLLNSNIAVLVINYFQARQLPYHGERAALAYLEAHEPGLCELLAHFYAAGDLERQVALTRQITDYVLAPIGGMWQAHEVLAFGSQESTALQSRGEALLRDLLGPPGAPDLGP